ncbi:MFS transporter permease [Alkalispirochaeta odontotermitis]|nr:MFS transporter permease [Alkalispirochaeta odontotermitis]CAB1074822.1 AmpG permease [Olavius algarvensis Delta 1 endosymbiont]
MPANNQLDQQLSLNFLQSISIYWERRLIFIFLMGFASGLPFLLSGATLSIWLTEAGVSLTTIGLFALVGTPYNLKFLWAPFIDRVPVPMLSMMLGRRRAWMLLIQVGLMASVIALGLSKPQTAPELTALLALAVAFFSASQDIVIDAYRIDILDEDQQGAGAAMTQAGYRFGLLAAGAGALYLASNMDWSIVYGIMAGLVLIGFIAALCAPVPPTDKLIADKENQAGSWFRKSVAAPFVEFFKRNNPQTALIILAFILLYKFGDAFAGVMANPFYIRIGFTKIEIANVSKIFGVFATLLGVFAGGLVVKRYGILRSLFYCGILQMLSNLMFAAQAVIGSHVGFLVLTIGIENLSGGMGSAAFVAYLSVLCNTAYTGTQFALFTSFMAFGRTWLSAMSGWIADQTDWATFFVISTFVALPGLLMLVWMIKRLPMSLQTGRPD